jgi:hypothetical protein
MVKIFIRHAEKDDDIGLSKIGLTRAANIKLILEQTEVSELGCVIAMKQKNKNTSDRCLLTVKNLLTDGVILVNELTKNQINEVVEKLIDFNEDVLVCWEHIRLIDIMKSYIYSTTGVKVDMSWNYSFFNSKDDSGIFDMTVVMDTIENGLSITVYRQFDVVQNDVLDLSKFELLKKFIVCKT